MSDDPRANPTEMYAAYLKDGAKKVQWQQIKDFVDGENSHLSMNVPMVSSMFMHPTQGMDTDGVEPTIILALRDTSGDSLITALTMADGARMVDGLMAVLADMLPNELKPDNIPTLFDSFDAIERRDADIPD